MSSTQAIIKQGDTTDTFQVSPFPLGELVENLSDPGWSCRSVVTNKLGGTIVIDNPVTTKTVDDLYFETSLASPDTDILDAKAYIWIIEIENLLTTPIYRREHHISLVVEKQGAPDLTEIETCFDINTIGTAAGSFLDIDIVVIDNAALPEGTITRVDLKDIGDNILQTAGYISSVVNGADLEITLTEDVTTAPVKICFIT